MKGNKNIIVILAVLAFFLQFGMIKVQATTVLKGIVLENSTPVFNNASTDAKQIKTFSKGKIIRFTSFNKNWYRAHVYANGGYQEGYIPKSGVETAVTNPSSLEGITTASPTLVYDKHGNQIKTFSRGEIIRYTNFSEHWYRANVYANGGYQEGYISKRAVETAVSNPSSLEGITMKQPTPVYGRKGKRIKTYSQGEIIRYTTFTEHWYRANVFADGGYQYGYIPQSSVETAVTNPSSLKGITAKAPTPVYGRDGSQIKTYTQGNVIRYSVFTRHWYRASVYANGGYQAGYIPKSTVETLDTTPKEIEGYALRSPTKVYARVAKAAKVIKTYEKGIHLDLQTLTSNWYKVTFSKNNRKKVGYVYKKDISLEPLKVYKTNKYDYTFNDMVGIQMSVNPQANGSGTKNATREQVEYYVNPSNFSKDQNTYYQFLNLSRPTNVNVNEVNQKILNDTGILSNRAQAFVDAGKKHGINEIYLIAHALHETGNGSSMLANGVRYSGKTVYNVYGYGAKDSCPIRCGAKKAYEEGWTTVRKAIVGGAKFIRNNYIDRGQDTLYKMRWHPDRPGTHQYATHVAWAVSQTDRISSIYNILNNYSLKFEVPQYSKQPDSSGSQTNYITYPKGIFGYTADRLNFREGPSTDNDIIKVLSNGARINLIGENSNHWYKVRVEGQTGWVSGNYVRRKNLLQVNVDSGSSLNVRNQPEGNRVGSLDNHAYIRAILDKEGIVTQDGWYKIDFNGQTSWVHGDYIQKMR